jgi:hypothetical protein
MKKNGKTTKYQDHDQTNPLHGINFSMAVVDPENLTNCGHHGNDSGGIDITKFKGDKK